MGTRERERPKDFSGEGEMPADPGRRRQGAPRDPIFVDAFSYLRDMPTTADPEDHHSRARGWPT